MLITFSNYYGIIFIITQWNHSFCTRQKPTMSYNRFFPHTATQTFWVQGPCSVTLNALPHPVQHPAQRELGCWAPRLQPRLASTQLRMVIDWQLERKHDTKLLLIIRSAFIDGTVYASLSYAEHMTDSSEKADAGKDWGQEKGMTEDEMVGWHHWLDGHAAPAAANSLQSCPTLCDPIDSSPSGSPVPGILQARTLE